jgi:hypothetical protein
VTGKGLPEVWVAAAMRLIAIRTMRGFGQRERDFGSLEGGEISTRDGVLLDKTPKKRGLDLL